jgi:hypothetical protein
MRCDADVASIACLSDGKRLVRGWLVIKLRYVYTTAALPSLARIIIAVSWPLTVYDISASFASGGGLRFARRVFAKSAGIPGTRSRSRSMMSKI